MKRRFPSGRRGSTAAPQPGSTAGFGGALRWIANSRLRLRLGRATDDAPAQSAKPANDSGKATPDNLARRACLLSGARVET